MKIVELIIDETDEYSGIDAISVVEYPAIEENFVALNNKKEYKFKSVDDEKKLLVGALLVPNKMIYRKDGDEEYYIHFSKDTVRKASQLYLMRGYQSNATYEQIGSYLSRVLDHRRQRKRQVKQLRYGLTTRHVGRSYKSH